VKLQRYANGSILKNWRHSFTGTYWIFDVATQSGQPLDPVNPGDRVQLASWSPKSDAVIFTRGNNLFLRKLTSTAVIQITEDGGTDLFYGVPDWVYEEEVFSGNSATWWADDGKFVAFLRTNESAVPEYPVQYFIKRPSGSAPSPGLENYPEVREIKYPKAGAPNPVVDLQFYDVEKDEVFSVKIDGDFPDTDRLITEVIWAGSTGNVLVRETNRESDILKVVLIDVRARTGKVVRTVDVNALDGGWFEVSEDTRYIPADPTRGRPDHGYIDTVIHDGYDHLAYFTPIDNDIPIYLTSGPWEVVKAPSAVDLTNNVVYFIGTKESPTQRHVYSVRLNGSDLTPVTDISKEGYYDVSFSKGTGYGLLSYSGPNIPWQKVFSTPYNRAKYEDIIEENKPLAELAAQHELPILIYQNVTVDGFTLQVVERRPPHFNPKKKYPLVFFLYGGPGSQTVSKRWNVDFQSYIAATLGYIVVTVDGRGTGFIGRKARCIIRGNVGHYEAMDQIETAKIWAAKPYVDESRLAIWGWSYGGFMTLKTLEQDGGQTFQYGMAVAPVTDWRFYGRHSISTGG
jgi:dipeptidyl aminopeptidase